MTAPFSAMRQLLRLLALPLLLASCSGGSDPVELTNAGYQALGRSDWDGALAQFEKALASMEPSDKQYMRAAMGSIRAKAHVEPQAAVADTMDLVEAGKATDEDVATAGTFLMDAKAMTEAVDLMDRGLQRFESSTALASLKEKVMAASESDPAVAAQLEGLGYL